MEEFRFHMTLTGDLARALADLRARLGRTDPILGLAGKADRVDPERPPQDRLERWCEGGLHPVGRLRVDAAREVGETGGSTGEMFGALLRNAKGEPVRPPREVEGACRLSGLELGCADRHRAPSSDRHARSWNGAAIDRWQGRPIRVAEPRQNRTSSDCWRSREDSNPRPTA